MSLLKKLIVLIFISGISFTHAMDTHPGIDEHLVNILSNNQWKILTSLMHLNPVDIDDGAKLIPSQDDNKNGMVIYKLDLTSYTGRLFKPDFNLHLALKDLRGNTLTFTIICPLGSITYSVNITTNPGEPGSALRVVSASPIANNSGLDWNAFRGAQSGVLGKQFIKHVLPLLRKAYFQFRAANSSK